MSDSCGRLSGNESFITVDHISRNSYSRSFKVMHLEIAEKATRGCNVGQISKVFEEIATENGENCRCRRRQLPCQQQQSVPAAVAMTSSSIICNQRSTVSRLQLIDSPAGLRYEYLPLYRAHCTLSVCLSVCVSSSGR